MAEVDWFAPEDFNEIMQVNFLGTVRVTKALLPLLRKARGRVVNLSSLSGEFLLMIFKSDVDMNDLCS